MGRSLGSASALELAANFGDDISGLVIESGFAYALPLLRLLGVNTERLGITEEKGFNNIAKIKKYSGPLLVIHAEKDHIIPFSDGRALYEACPSTRKEFLEIKARQPQYHLPARRKRIFPEDRGAGGKDERIIHLHQEEDVIMYFFRFRDLSFTLFPDQALL